MNYVCELTIDNFYYEYIYLYILREFLMRPLQVHQKHKNYRLRIKWLLETEEFIPHC